MRQKIVAGNWKMHKTFVEGQGLAQEIRTMAESEITNDVKLVVFPPFIHLHSLGIQLRNSKIEIGSQNVNENIQGAFTGEVSADMLLSVGINIVLIGHSERRQYYNETNESCQAKIKTMLSKEMIPYYCIGETLEERNNGQHFKVVENQLKIGLNGLTHQQISKVVFAYEPVWAIGTGVTASAEQANEMHIHIRKIIAELSDENTANSISILYGGSVKPENAKELFGMSDIDGGLIGGAALNSRSFIDIAKSIN